MRAMERAEREAQTAVAFGYCDCGENMRGACGVCEWSSEALDYAVADCEGYERIVGAMAWLPDMPSVSPSVAATLPSAWSAWSESNQSPTPSECVI